MPGADADAAQLVAVPLVPSDRGSSWPTFLATYIPPTPFLTLQHHIWLMSNAKTLLVLIPGMPKMNFLLVSCIYYRTARELYRITMSTRGMFLPDDKRACIRNLLGLVASFAACGAVAVACVL